MTQERLPRCRGHRRGGAATDYELRRDQDARAERSSLAPPRALPPCPPAHGYHQPDPRLSHRTRHHRTARPRTLAQGAARGLKLTSRGALTADTAPHHRAWRRLDERIEVVSAEIESLSENDAESTGDRTKLGRISKRGNKYLRTLFVQAAHVVIERRPAAAMRAPLALDPPGFQALGASQSARDRPRQQARTHRLGGARLAATTSQGSRPMPHNIRSLRFTKGMASPDPR
jgi:hypothetical protein